MLNTDVLIIGAGPTGLMLGCQLQRFGIPFYIIDQQADRAHESRALAIQAKSMEIFQNLGIVQEFLQRARTGTQLRIFINGKEKLKLKFENVDVPDTPFPSIYFLAQSDTEKILLQHLAKFNIYVQRQVSLMQFSQHAEGYTATLQHELTGETETINCRYIVGCDGAHSKVRHQLDIPFEGASYKEEFMLADGKVDWSYPQEEFMAFFDKKGIFLKIPLDETLNRVMGARIGKTLPENQKEVTSSDLVTLGRVITHTQLQLSDVVWMTHFYLHHRMVTNYQRGNAFLAGDAAHIHSPVGGQGMNTGLQDATNLAWKLAFVIKNKTSPSLLQTYNLERHRVGAILLKTTDRVFSFMTANNIVNTVLRTIMLSLMFVIPKIAKCRYRLFRFISQLGIHYHANAYVYEATKNADKQFLQGPRAGCRAPDAPYDLSTLFEIFSKNPCNILLFNLPEQIVQTLQQHLNKLEKSNARWIQSHIISKSISTQIIFDRYGVTNSAIYFIRPDGYIGFRSYGENINELLQYLNKLCAG